jgi:hypothetical protein
VIGRLSDLPGLLEGVGVDPSRVGADDAAQLAAAAPAIAATVVDLLQRVRARELGNAPAGVSEEEMLAGVRTGWL